MNRLLDFFAARDGCWRRDAFVIVLLAVVLWVIPSAFRDITDRSEALYLHIAHNIVVDDNWLVLTIHDQPYGEKPPLPFIAYAAMMELAGGEVVPALVRLPVHLATITILLLTYAMGRAHFGRRMGLLSALVLATILQYAKESTEARLDMQFALWNTVAMVIWLMRRDERRLGWGAALGFWAAMSAATFTKGPLSFFFVFAVIVFDAVRLRDWKVAVLGTKPLLALPMIGLPAYIWLNAVAREAGVAFLDQIVGRNVVGRITQQEVSHSEPFYYYLETLFTQTAPLWGLVYVFFLVAWWRGGRREWERVSPIVAWWMIPFILMCIASGKRATYLMPLFPAMALGVGWFLDRVVIDSPPKPVSGYFVAAAAGLLAVILGLTGIAFLVVPELGEARDLSLHAVHGVLVVLLAIVCGGASVMVMRRGGAWVAQFVAVIAMMGSLQIMTFGVMEPAGQHRESSRRFVGEVAALLPGNPADTTIGVIGRADHPRYTFHAEFATAQFKEELEFFSDPMVPDLMLVEEEEYEDRVKRDPAGAERWQVLKQSTVAGREILLLQRRDSPL
jgi:4-amino-4-deoxy-L-arabinose transferase-like glycosyltransferase